MINLSELEKLVKATPRELQYLGAIDPTTALALIRIARTAQISADDACIHADLYEALKEIE